MSKFAIAKTLAPTVVKSVVTGFVLAAVITYVGDIVASR
jgi:hypothetical protein